MPRPAPHKSPPATVLPPSTLACLPHPPPATEHLHQNVFFLPLITVLIVLIPTIPLKYNITNTSFIPSHLLPPLIHTPALYIYLSYLHFLPQLLLFLSQLLFILHIHFLLFILHIYFLLYISIYSLITLYICTYSALFAILHFWLDAKLHFVASVLVLSAMTIKLNLALLILGYMISNKTWKLFTGLCLN